MTINDQKLSLGETELVAVGASVGAGCHPCVDHHLKAGANAGLDGGQLLAAVTSAERVTDEAAVLMGDHVRARLGPNVAESALLSRLDEALASLGAALGANDATNIERQLRTALELGATRPRLEQAIETARTVQENAARIHVRQAERLLETLAASVDVPEDAARSDESCGCGAEDEGKPSPAGAEAADSPRAAAPANDVDDTASDRAKGPATGCAPSMAELFATRGSAELTGIPAAMADCQRMFATEAVGPCGKEA